MSIDVKKDHKALYCPPATDFVEVDVPPMRYLAIDGHGDPNTVPEYARAVEALYALAYAVRSALKARTGDAWVVGPLEGLWHAPDRSVFTSGSKGDWDWTMLIPLPEAVTDDDLAAGRAKAEAKVAKAARADAATPPPPLGEVRVLEFTEGRCLQILHVGSYDAEAPTLARLHEEVIPSRGLVETGEHHEIYLSDPRRTAPERLRTVLRQPVGTT